jgi:hypothetical protein
MTESNIAILATSDAQAPQAGKGDRH